MFKIGEFSTISRVPVKTLRYYDEIGLLHAAHIDSFTGYRYYTVDQLTCVHRILALKDLGFSLEQIARLLDEQLSLQAMQEILYMKQAELQNRVQEEQERLARVAARLQLITQENAISQYEMRIKHVEPQMVASLRAVVPTYPDIRSLFDELYSYLRRQGASGGVCAAIYHDGEYRERAIDNEAIIFLNKPLPEDGQICVYELPAATVATTIYYGSYIGLGAAYTALMAWMKVSGYQIVAPERELYLRAPSIAGVYDDKDCVTEIQFPIQQHARIS